MFRIIWLVAALCLSALRPAFAEPRLALVIGNGGYVAVSGLPNPANDARLMADALNGAGFTVTLVQDGDLAGMRAAVAAFGAGLRAAGPEATGLFFYAGHGVQSFGRNYLLPVDAALSNAADLGLVAVEAESVLRQMASARNRTNIVILDACRNNPFKNVLDLGENGLAEMAAPTGTFLAYATAPGAVALDGVSGGAGGNSPFSAALAREIPVPGLPIEQAFKNVRVKVLAETGGAQTPWDTSSLTADFVFSPVGAPVVDSAEAVLWEKISAARDAVQIMLYLRAYPDSPNVAAATKLLAAVMQAEVAGAAAGEAQPAGDAGAGDGLAGVQSANGADPGARDAVDGGADAGAASGAAGNPGAQTAGAQAAGAQAAGGEAALAEALAAQIAAAPVRFGTALVAGPKGLVGKSLAELITGTPQFAPFEGLPEAAWKDQACGNCHKWTQAALCDQGKVYAGEPIARAVSKEHPLGAGFKLALRAWAEGGCQ